MEVNELREELVEQRRVLEVVQQELLDARRSLSDEQHRWNWIEGDNARLRRERDDLRTAG